MTTLFLQLPLAHLSIDGLGAFGSGMLHPFVNPAQILIIVGIALLIGRQVPLQIKEPILAFSASAALGLGLTAAGFGGLVWQPLMIFIALCLGLLIAIGKPIPPMVVSGLCAISAAALGLDSGMKNENLPVVLQALSGTWISLWIVVGYIAVASSHATGKPWAVAAVRIVGSWLVAISMMVMAFSMRK